ncbi:MAG: hypothetical protein ACE5FE_03155 [Acidiferrobacterales bacterium]
MITRVKLTARRRFLGVLAYLGLVGIVRPQHSLSAPHDEQLADSLARKLAAFSRQTTGARNVGREYLLHVPAENKPHVLVDLICATGGWRHAELANTDSARLRVMLQDRIRRDFANGQVVNLHGWILSQTETRLYALAALL